VKRAVLAPVDRHDGAYRYDGILPLAWAVYHKAFHLIWMPVRNAVLDGTRREV